MEAKLDNPDGWRVAGASVGLYIQLPEQKAIRLSPALLALDKLSQLGVYVLDEQNRMHWQAITLLSITPDEAWVSGLPSSVRLVTRGADFVEAGTVVKFRMVETVANEPIASESNTAELIDSQLAPAKPSTPAELKP